MGNFRYALLPEHAGRSRGHRVVRHRSRAGRASSMIPIYRGEEALAQLAQLSQQSTTSDNPVEEQVKAIIAQVKEKGDQALRKLGQRFGDQLPKPFLLSEAEV